MSNLITLEAVDVDGAVREAEEGALGAAFDRGQFIKRGAVAGGSFLAAGVLFSGLASPAQAAISTSRSSKKNDVKILNYALTLEYLESAFYDQAVANNNFANQEVRAFAQAVRAHEAAHVKYLRKALGKAAIKSPKFAFGDTVTDPTKFQVTAQVLEDTGVAAYAGQGPNIAQRGVVKAALSIHSVEARHAAWIRYLNAGGAPGAATATQPAPATFDKPLSEKAVLKAVKGTGFLG